jgi:hypothetical protein
MGAIGIWPLSDRYGRLMKAAQLKESRLIGRMMRKHLEQPPRFPQESSFYANSRDYVCARD